MGIIIPTANSVIASCKYMVGQYPITIIAALAQGNRVIGHNGQLPWHLPDDLKRFKTLTLGYPIIMGRKTWEFCLNKRLLPHRHNIVVSRSCSKGPMMLDHSGSAVEDTSFHRVRSLPDALTLAQQLSKTSHSTHLSRRIFIMGGASIYAQTLSLAHRLELTMVHGAFEGDAFFPPYEHLLPEFDCVASLHQPHTMPPSTYITYERRATIDQ